MVEITLKHSVKGDDGKAIKKVLLRRPTVRDHSDLQSSGADFSSVNGDVMMVSRLAQVPISVIQSVRMGDWTVVQGVLESFLAG